MYIRRGLRRPSCLYVQEGVEKLPHVQGVGWGADEVWVCQSLSSLDHQRLVQRQA